MMKSCLLLCYVFLLASSSSSLFAATHFSATTTTPNSAVIPRATPHQHLKHDLPINPTSLHLTHKAIYLSSLLARCNLFELITCLKYPCPSPSSIFIDRSVGLN